MHTSIFVHLPILWKKPSLIYSHITLNFQSLLWRRWIKYNSIGTFHSVPIFPRMIFDPLIKLSVQQLDINECPIAMSLRIPHAKPTVLNSCASHAYIWNASSSNTKEDFLLYHSVCSHFNETQLYPSIPSMKLQSLWWARFLKSEFSHSCRATHFPQNARSTLIRNDKLSIRRIKIIARKNDIDFAMIIERARDTYVCT
jgi:hypothetical protein